mgnify:CR=1 FL=1
MNYLLNTSKNALNVMITGYISSSKGTVTIDGCEILENPAETKKKVVVVGAGVAGEDNDAKLRRQLEGRDIDE